MYLLRLGGLNKYNWIDPNPDTEQRQKGSNVIIEFYLQITQQSDDGCELNSLKHERYLNMNYELWDVT